MTIAYTDNFHFPLLDDGAGNSGAVMNGVLEDMDRILYEANNPLCMDDELLIYEDEPLFYA
ncbi:MAG: hypothetical protein M0R74_17885 [Dehalococcoidia bacterium]|nr:hypothetical protein [Dehalococcoidia bacterium]